MIGTKEVTEILKAFEPKALAPLIAKEGTGRVAIYTQLDLVSQVSIAISLKRLADYFAHREQK